MNPPLKPRVVVAALAADLRAQAAQALAAHCEVAVVADAAGVWQAIESAPPALVLVDATLPGSATGRLWQELCAGTVAFPVLVLAAEQEIPAAADELAKLSPTDVLRPPYSQHEILCRVLLRLELERQEQRALARALELQQSEEHVQLAVLAADVGTWDYKPLTDSLEWSDRCKAAFGLPPEAPISLDVFFERLHPADRTRLRQIISEVLDPTHPRGGLFESDYRALWPDGTVRWIVAKGKAFFEGMGAQRRAVRFIGTVNDITERKQVEQTLQDADRRKDLFLATLAHELRNPLAPISNALQLWPLVSDDAGQMEELHAVMERQVQQLIRLIDDLLDLSRISRGRIQLRRQRVELSTILESAIETANPFIEAGRHTLSLQLAGAPLVVDADVARLVQVFGNLLHNAAKYTTQGGQIAVYARSEAGQAVVSVRDNGAGIPPEMLGKIFEMFTQVDATLERSHGGLGIGLTLVKTLVEMHHGKIEAHSAGAGQGAEFIVRLPLVDASVPEVVIDLAAQRITMRLPRRRVLIVDDVKASAQTLSLMLSSIGQQTEMAFDGPTALEAIAGEPPDIVFLDIAMPGMSGYEVARRIRQQPGLQNLMLVALTGYGQDEDRRKSQAAGFNRHLVKPITLDVLHEVLLQSPGRH